MQNRLSNLLRTLCALGLCLPALQAAAQGDTSQAPAAAAAVSAAEGPLSISSLMSWLLSTLAVLLLIFVAAWLLRKSRFASGRGAGMRILGQLAVGPKERLVKVEVDGRRLLVGVTPSSVRLVVDLDRENDDFQGYMHKAGASEMSPEPQLDAGDGSEDGKEKSGT